ncbi:hypothetical protein [Thauera propionica]|jgi:hypothetical protein|uniref:hypothetical protein n=1 Tax=Thauera propionica TaxID=2019431 RepID=UPI0023F4258B|nr:hypothetical protein [Thauera propionica]MDD3675225.1 hypothetical protein [Thauera propionica]
MPSESTPRGYPLPHPTHLLSDDVHRLREAITRIDADITEAAQQHSSVSTFLSGAIDGLAAEQSAADRYVHRLRLRALHGYDF